MRGLDSTMSSQAQCEKQALPIRPPSDSDHVPKNNVKNDENRQLSLILYVACGDKRCLGTSCRAICLHTVVQYMLYIRKLADLLVIIEMLPSGAMLYHFVQLYNMLCYVYYK